MFRRKGRRNTLRRLLLRVAVAWVTVVALAPNFQSTASADAAGTAGSLVLSSLTPSTKVDHHDSAAGHGGAEHCLSGSVCTSVTVLPEGVVLQIGKQTPTLIRAAFPPHSWDILPPLHPPISASLS